MAGEWKIDGKTALVTGGASGLGAGKVEALLKEGAQAVAILDISEHNGKSLTELLNKTYPGRVIFIKCNVANDESLTRAFNEVLAKLKRIDVIINNAGILNESLDQFCSMVDINLKGLVSLARKGIEHMRKDTGGAGGAIINISSAAAFVSEASVPVYSATKIGVLHYGRCLSKGGFYEKTGVRILTICYGPTNTALLHNLVEKSFDESSGRETLTRAAGVPYQNADSAVKGCIEMLKKGANGSIWMSDTNKKVEDITSVVEAAFGDMRKAFNCLQ